MGLDEEQSQRFLRSVIQGRDLQYQVELGRYSQIGDEAMDYLYASSQPTRVQGDIIVIGQPPKTFDAEADPTDTAEALDFAEPAEEPVSVAGRTDLALHVVWNRVDAHAGAAGLLAGPGTLR